MKSQMVCLHNAVETKQTEWILTSHARRDCSSTSCSSIYLSKMSKEIVTELYVKTSFDDVGLLLFEAPRSVFDKTSEATNTLT